MAVHDCVDVRTQLVDLAVDEALAVDRSAARIEGVAVEIERDQVVDRDIAWCDGLHLQVEVGIARVADADMAERIEHAVVGEDVVGGDQIDRDLAVEISVIGAEALARNGFGNVCHRPGALRMYARKKVCAALPMAASAGAMLNRNRPSFLNLRTQASPFVPAQAGTQGPNTRVSRKTGSPLSRGRTVGARTHGWN